NASHSLHLYGNDLANERAQTARPRSANTSSSYVSTASRSAQRDSSRTNRSIDSSYDSEAAMRRYASRAEAESRPAYNSSASKLSRATTEPSPVYGPRSRPNPPTVNPITTGGETLPEA